MAITTDQMTWATRRYITSTKTTIKGSRMVAQSEEGIMKWNIVLMLHERILTAEKGNTSYPNVPKGLNNYRIIRVLIEAKFEEFFQEIRVESFPWLKKM